MSRPLRIQYPGAWYHVMNRGACRNPIFHDDTQRVLFLKLLEEISVTHQVEIHAYCLMTNHYHLLIHTPNGNLSEAMHHLSSSYTVRYNKIQNADGPLFRGRYKSILVDSENYLIHLSRYLHLNPVEANIVTNAGDYVWSSYQAYLGFVTKPVWLITSEIERFFKKEQWPLNYLKFTNAGNSKSVIDFYQQTRISPILGTTEFIEKIKEDNCYLDTHEDVSDRFILKPTIEDIVKVTSVVYGVNLSDLYHSQRGERNIPRLIVILIARKYFGYKRKEIAEIIKIKSIKTVTSCMERIEKIIKEDAALAVKRDKILRVLSRQRET